MHWQAYAMLTHDNLFQHMPVSRRATVLPAESVAAASGGRDGKSRDGWEGATMPQGDHCNEQEQSEQKKHMSFGAVLTIGLMYLSCLLPGFSQLLNPLLNPNCVVEAEGDQPRDHLSNEDSGGQDSENPHRSALQGP
ncbi:unnamed protein product [Discosporangium mesarthrocarpum]